MGCSLIRASALNALVSSLSSEDKGGISKEVLNKKLDDVLGEKASADNAMNSSGEVCDINGFFADIADCI